MEVGWLIPNSECCPEIHTVRQLLLQCGCAESLLDSVHDLSRWAWEEVTREEPRGVCLVVVLLASSDTGILDGALAALSGQPLITHCVPVLAFSPHTDRTTLQQQRRVNVFTSAEELFAHITSILSPIPRGDTGDSVPDVDLFEGSVVGVAIGDAIGAVVEGSDQSEVEKFTTSLRVSLAHFGTTQVNHRHIAYAPGQVTDDTENTRELILSLLHGGPLGPHLAGRLSSLAHCNSIVGMGSNSRRALQRIAEGHSWLTAAHPTGLSNGSCMRATPCGLVAWRDPSGPVVQASSAVVACAVACALHHRIACPNTTDTSDLCTLTLSHIATLSSRIPGHDVDFAGALANMLECSSPQTALAALKAAVPLPPPDVFPTSTRNWPISTYAPHTALWAVFCFLRSPHDFWHSLLVCIAVGGDTDTVAAICGGISGAFNGLRAIRLPAKNVTKPHEAQQWWPSVIGRLLNSLRDTPHLALSEPLPEPRPWAVTELRHLARCLHSHVHPPTAINRAVQSDCQTQRAAILGAKDAVGVRVVGVSGCTCSGKTTVCSELSVALGISPEHHLDQDRYFMSDVVRQELSGDYDAPGALDLVSFARDLLEVLRSAPPGATLLIDGHRCLEPHPMLGITSLCDVVVWVTAPEATVRARRERIQRERWGWTDTAAQLTFQNVTWPQVWKSHCAYEERVREMGGWQWCEVNGEQAKEEMCAEALQRVRAAIDAIGSHPSSHSTGM